ncbi:hypothetical protein K2173_005290 [Erythroxylum novogranatense]|uniref:C-CAP/cofactor C-like domain-containing protein n=1 Tax=Erythroxylum novogranatense TaxID=1862640 RepID=A0AAV8TRS2_9ROSI|nr:hypothetical protein K2173_005290 [Erythroxylum novogranatense]
MEEELQSKATTMEATLRKKQQAMLDRLANRHQNRPKSTITDDSTSSSTAFSSKFSDSKRSVESQLAELPTLSDSCHLKSRLAEISSEISSLEQLVAESSYFLPSYDLRAALKSISDLKQSLEKLISELLPKKKFSFKNKSASKNVHTEPRETAKAEKSNPIITIPESPGFRNKQNEVLTKNFRGSEIGEFTISDLDSCEVRLIGSVRAAFINRLRNCKVYGGPVTGSILMEDVENCVFVLASHQIRIHCAKRCDFYVRVRSRPIIEDCGGLRFAPYCLKYDGIGDDLKEAGLDEESGNWSNVDDFKWLRAAQSPNWSVLDEGERVGSIQIEVLDNGNGKG